MTTAHDNSHIDLTAPDLRTLVQEVLDRLIGSRDAQGGKTWIAIFSVDVPSAEALMHHIIDDIALMSQENDATILQCDVSGVQDIDDGIRAWGTIELADGRTGRGVIPALDTVSLQHTDDGHWHIDACTGKRGTA